MDEGGRDGLEGPDGTVSRDLWLGSKYRPQWFRGEAETFEKYDPFYYLSPSWACHHYYQPRFPPPLPFPSRGAGRW